jgi:hypothetical protein
MSSMLVYAMGKPSSPQFCSITNILSLTYAEIAEQFPEDFKARDEDKYNYRYRGGESYRDVVIRLEPIIMELERSENILIVTHQATLRCIYAYFMEKNQENAPWENVPLHTLIKLTPRAYGTQEEIFPGNIPSVSTWRGKGSVAKHEDAPEGTGVGGAARKRTESTASTITSGHDRTESMTSNASAGKEAVKEAVAATT